ncbi:MAG: hypothetical protein QOD58_2500, partial [Mycobacterium sp.]|nr:hypothetical protein [Mycobacterium sp.]
MAKQTPKQTPDEDERGSLARPPWLPGEKKRRRVHLGRGKDKDAEKDDAGKRAEKIEGDANGHGRAKSEEPTAKAHLRPQRTAAEEAVREPPPKRDRIPVSRAKLDSPAEAEAKRDRIPMAPPEPDGAAPSQPKADVAPESRPRRVAVRYDRARRLQPDPVPPAPAPPLTSPTPAPVTNDFEAAQASRLDEQPLAAEPTPPQADGTIEFGLVGPDSAESLSQPSDADELPLAATTESLDATPPPLDEWELLKSEIWNTG